MSKNSITIDGLKIISNKIIPFGRYVAITMFGRVFTRKSMKDLKKYLDTSAGKRMIKHESIHVMQAKDECKSWIKFYVLYLWYFVKMLFWCFKWDMSYKTIPFEIEAYKYQNTPEYNKTFWKSFKMSNKKRKKFYTDKYIKRIMI